jgi:hypothetical protein
VGERLWKRGPESTGENPVERGLSIFNSKMKLVQELFLVGEISKERARGNARALGDFSL